MSDARGALFVSRPQAEVPGAFHEEAIPFTTLDELLAACAANTLGGAFVRVQVTGDAAGKPHRLVLDFGHFGPVEG